MGLVQSPIDNRNVQQPMNPVDEEIGEDQEYGSARDHVGPGFPSSRRSERSFFDCVVQHTPASHIPQEPRQRQEIQEREGFQGEVDLFRDLIFQIARMEFHAMVKDEVVREGCDGEVEDEDADVGETVEGYRLAQDAVSW